MTGKIQRTHFEKSSQKLLRKSVGIFILFLSLIYVVPSCRIGLGEAVDTKSPELNITQPTPDTPPIRGAFDIKGTCSDDGTIERITVVLRGLDADKNDDKRAEYKYDLKESGGKVTLKDQKEWRCPVDPIGELLTDGSYEVTVSILDTYHHETTDKVSITIDNTKPVLVLTRPSTVYWADSPDTYGQELTITGQTADDSDVGLIEMEIYKDEACEELLETVQLKKIPPTIDLTVTEFMDEGGAYRGLYGGNKMDGTKRYYCRIKAYDDARLCPDEGEEAGRGNMTEIYYLYEDIFDDVLSEYKVTQVYSMMSGRYGGTGESDRAAADEESKRIKEILEKKQIERGSFALNPMNSQVSLYQVWSR